MWQDPTRIDERTAEWNKYCGEEEAA
jgi:hypothetical protein